MLSAKCFQLQLVSLCALCFVYGVTSPAHLDGVWPVSTESSFFPAAALFSLTMNEAILLRSLRQFRKVRGPDFHQPATRDNQGKIENGGGLEKASAGFMSRSSALLHNARFARHFYCTMSSDDPLPPLPFLHFQALASGVASIHVRCPRAGCGVFTWHTRHAARLLHDAACTASQLSRSGAAHSTLYYKVCVRDTIQQYNGCDASL